MDSERGGRRRYGNGNSTTGFKDFANRLPAFDRGLLKQCESFHFVNFPEDWGAKQLFYFIRTTVKAGRLWDIFIPSKRDRRGNRYGFARFLDARNEQEMKKQLGNIWIGNQRVVFNSAVERRKEKRRMEAKPAEEASWKSDKRTINAEDKNTVEEGSRKIPRMTYAQCLLQQKDMANSFASGNKDPTPSESKEFPRRPSKGTPKTPNVSRPVYKKVIELTDTDKAEDKLMKCAVGVVSSPSIIPNLPEIFFNEGFPSIKIAPMGGNLVLIDDEDPEYVKELVDGNLQWVAAYFDRIKFWTPSDIAEERFVWVRIQGLPIHAWSEESLSTIGNHVGNLVSIDEYTLSKECLDAARILVSTKSKLAINEEFILKVKNNSFHIAVVEENWRTDPWWLKKAVSSIAESEVSSTEFKFGEDSGGFDGDSMNGLEEEEIQTPTQRVNGINCSDTVRGSKKLVEMGKFCNGTLSNQECGEQRKERESRGTNRKLIRLSTEQDSDVQIIQETAQLGSPKGSENEAQVVKNKTKMGDQENGGLQADKSSNKSPPLLPETRIESTKLVTGTNRGRRRKATIQPVNFGGESPVGSLSDSDILYNNRRIKEGMIAEEAKKVLDFGSKLGIQTKNQEEQILERFKRMEERDMQGYAREPLSVVKRKVVRNMVRKEEINFACFQETKIETIDKDFCVSIWGHENFDWAYKASVGRSGGVLCVWDNDIFVKEAVVEIPGAVAIYGLWGLKKQKCCIVNVYASCNRNERMELWAKLQRMIEEDDGFWCIAGDFNSVRSEEERRGRSEHSRYREDLNDFIESAGLNDLPLTRRKFTWYKSDGSAMSRLDRFLISDGLLTFWGDCCQVGLNRSISDHCPVILKKVNSDWGPKPFRALNCWDQHPDFIRVVEDIWKSTEVGGWSGYVCKEKFKQLRNKLKTWNIEVFGNFEHQIADAEAKIKGVDSKNDENEITEEDILLRREGFSELWEAWQRREVAWKQKTKLDWVQQGDANSKLFHRIASVK
ncbi:hypothetical protein SLEP1_g52662 [Rubroshorea leprosula]|uniref:Endonuclease/exonuclease/phosphatase domain-containing protein n=1 Tax=Rubroshorea leprosula TaxID=152421 RepID=A0AAV5MAS0_9ROSI|nr:hypothetical protein SLEP1_g52662 [Rubroshorea leprosula]